METLLNLRRHHILVKNEARLGTYRLKFNKKCARKCANWKNSNNTISSNGQCLDANKIFFVATSQNYNRNETKDNTNIPWLLSLEHRWVKKEGGTGTTIKATTHRSKVCISLGTMATAYQAELYATNECLLYNLRKRYNKRKIFIHSDSQTVLKALENYKHNSKLTWKYQQNLIKLSTSKRTACLGNRTERKNSKQKIRCPC